MKVDVLLSLPSSPSSSTEGEENATSFDISHDATVSTLKEVVIANYGHLANQRLFFYLNDELLTDSHYLRDLKLEDRTILITTRPVETPMIKIKMTIMGRSIDLTLPSNATLANLQSELLLKEGFEKGNYELMFRGQSLDLDNGTLASNQIGNGATIEVILPRMAIPKGRCSMGGCNERAAKIVGDCRYCGLGYCSRHRLPESHSCENLQGCRQQSYEKNSSKLMGEKCVPGKF